MLGAGNCNDLDLAALAAAYRDIHLIDIDPEALQRARERQPEEVAEKLILRAPVDLSGIFDWLPRLRGQALSGEELAALTAAATDRVLAALPERFDQAGLLLLDEPAHAQLLSGPGPSSAARGDWRRRGRRPPPFPGGAGGAGWRGGLRQRYRLVGELSAGRALGGRPPLRLLEELEAAGNVQSGTAPTFVRRTLKAFSADLAGPPRLIEPWLWRLDDSLTFLVYALSCAAGPDLHSTTGVPSRKNDPSIR